jgi:enoyl-CoA hydratase/carnithine racemase
MSDGRVDIELGADGCLCLTLDRPEKGNALSAEMTHALQAAFAAPAADARFILLRGVGNDFCAGRDSPMPPKDARISAADIRARVADPVLQFYETLRTTPLPVIAAVRGRAHGVGFALAGLADIVIAEPDADFCVPEMDRDIPPLLVAYALADRIPRQSLARAVFGREHFNALGAQALGIVGEVSDALDHRIAFWRSQLAGNSATTLRTMKRFLTAAPDMSFGARREYAAAAISGAVSERFITPKED